MTLALIDPVGVAQAAMVRNADSDLQTAMERQQRILREETFALDLTLHGTLDLVFFEQAARRGQSLAGAKAEGKGVINWNLQGPRVAFSRTGTELLIRDAMGELPLCPQFFWKGEGKAPMVRQRWENVSAGLLESNGGEMWATVYPLRQIVIKTLQGLWLDVQCSKDHTDAWPALYVLLNRNGAPAGPAYFIGGRMDIRVR